MLEGHMSMGNAINDKAIYDRKFLWHKRMGYICDKRLQELSKEGCYVGIRSKKLIYLNIALQENRKGLIFIWVHKPWGF